jgi:multiple sugar transport system permease protein
MKPGAKKLNTSMGFGAYFFILPAIIVLGFYSVYPLIYNIVMSFYKWDMGDPTSKPVFIGIKNFITVWGEENFTFSMQNSFVFSVITVGLAFIIGLWLAVLLSQEFKGASIFRSIFLIPLAITPVVTGLMWRMILNPSNGLMNYLLSFLNITGPNWLADSKLAFISICFVDVWMWTPFMMIVFVAALKSIPPELHEAASVDGASRWSAFWKITFPLIMPVTIVVVLIRFIDSFKTFDQVFTLTRGGPGISTELLGLYIYKQGLKYFNIGKTSAAVIIFMIIIFIISYFAIRKTLKRD